MSAHRLRMGEVMILAAVNVGRAWIPALLGGVVAFGGILVRRLRRDAPHE